MIRRSDTITLIYIRNKTGEPHSVEVSLKVAKLAIISIVIILLVSTLTSFFSVNLYMENDSLVNRMIVLHGEKGALADKLLVLERALADTYNREKETSEKSKLEDLEAFKTSALLLLSGLFEEICEIL